MILLVGKLNDPHLTKISELIYDDNYCILDLDNLQYSKILYDFDLDKLMINGNIINSIYFRGDTNNANDDSFKEYYILELNYLLLNIREVTKSIYFMTDIAGHIEYPKYSQLSIAKKNDIKIPQTFALNYHYSKLNRQTKYFKKPLQFGGLKTKSNSNKKSFMVPGHLYSPKFNDYVFSPNPQSVQNYIEKEYELRIIYIDGKLLSAKIDSQSSGIDSVKLHYRLFDPMLLEHSKYDLPSDVEKNLAKMMREMSFNFGCIDMIKSTTGEYVFLEVNPNGQWLWLDILLDLGVGKEIANTLLRHNG
jgi:hypothetical protein